MAGEIPFPQAPKPPEFAIPNPLEMMGQLQTMQAQRQAFEQQQQTFAAKNAFGEILQHHVDPETGEVNWDSAIAHASADPRAALAMPEIYEKALSSKKTILENLEKEQQLMAKRLENGSSIATAQYMKYAEDLQRSGARNLSLPEQQNIAAAWIREQNSAGLLNEKQVPMALSVLNQRLSRGENIGSILRSTMQMAQAGRETLEKNKLTLGAYAEGGGDGMVPQAAITQFSPRAPSAAQNPATTSPAPAGGAARQGVSSPGLPADSSAPPAATETTFGTEEFSSPNYTENPTTNRKYKQVMEEGKGPWVEEVQKPINDAAALAQVSQKNITEARQLMREVEAAGGTTGPTAKLRAQATALLQELSSNLNPQAQEDYEKATGYSLKKLAEGTSELVAAEKPKEWLASVDALAKLSMFNAVSNIKTAVGQGSRITTPEVMKSMEISPNITMSPQGIERIFKFMQRINEDAMEAQAQMQHYEQHPKNKNNVQRALNPQIFNEERAGWLKHKGSLKFE